MPVDTSPQMEQTEENEVVLSEETTTTSPSTFKIENIPVSKAEIGDFPFIKLPNDYEFKDSAYGNDTGIIKDYDKEYFYDHGINIPVEGKTFKAVIRVDKTNKNKTYSKLELQKSLENLMQRAGAVQLNDGKETDKKEDDRLRKLDPNAYNDGYKHSSTNYDNVYTYIIRKENKNVWVQYNFGSDFADITVLETKPFESEVDFIPASRN